MKIQYLQNNSTVQTAEKILVGHYRYLGGSYSRPKAASLCTFEQDFQQLSLLLLSAVLDPQLIRANCPHGTHRYLIKEGKTYENYLLGIISFNYILMANVLYVPLIGGASCLL